MALLLRVTFVERIPPRNRPFFFQRQGIVNMNNGVRPACVQELFIGAFPVRVFDPQLNLWD